MICRWANRDQRRLVRKTAKIVKRSVSRAKVTSRAAGEKDARLRDWERCHDANGRVRVDSAPGGRKGVEGESRVSRTVQVNTR